jgi:hypothetical protein
MSNTYGPPARTRVYEGAVQVWDGQDWIDIVEDDGGDPFNGGTITDPLTIDGSDQAVPSLVVDASGATGKIATFRKANGDLVGYFGTTSGLFAPGSDKPTLEVSKDQLVVNIDADLSGFFGVSDIDGNTLFDIEADGAVSVVPPSGSLANPFRVMTEAGAYAFYVEPSGIVHLQASRVTATGAVVIRATAAPGDGELTAGDMALWFDETDGAGKLMVKAKTANGTVRTGSVNLT